MKRVTLVSVGAAVLAAAGLVLGTASGDDTEAGMLPVASLEEISGTWSLVDDQSAPAPLVAAVTLQFAEGGLFVDTGCNTGRGPVSVDDSRLVLLVDHLATTRRACEPTLAAQEAWVLDMVASTPRLERGGPMLALHWGEGERYWVNFQQVVLVGDGTSTTT